MFILDIIHIQVNKVNLKVRPEEEKEGRHGMVGFEGVAWPPPSLAKLGG